MTFYYILIPSWRILGKNRNPSKTLQIILLEQNIVDARENPFWLPDTIYSLVLDVTFKIL